MTAIRAAALDTAEGVSLQHAAAMMVPAGIVQFAQGARPDPVSGTCLDDNARAWIAAMLALAADAEYPHARDIGEAAMGFVVRAQRPDGAFFNMADITGAPLEAIGSEESIGRAVWACGLAARCATVAEWRDAGRRMLEAALPAVERLTINHARAYSLLGLCMAVAPESAWPARPCSPPISERLDAACREVLDRVVRAYESTLVENSRPDWPWWDDMLAWGNGRLPEAMLRASIALRDERLGVTGLRALAFLGDVTQSGGIFVPIGNEGWYRRGGNRATHDQQPIEACGMVDAWLAAYRLTGDSSHLDRACVAYEWFEGRNTEELEVGVPETGASFDGLARGYVNRNQGAESTLSYVHARLMLDAATLPAAM
jgi:hypothetical protein